MLPFNLPQYEKCYIIGGGVSVKFLDLSPLQGNFVIGVNNSFFLYDWISYCWFGDNRWYLHNEARLKKCRNKIATCNHEFKEHKEIICLPRRKLQGIETEFPYVSWNRCSGGSAINFAYHCGAKKIILIGFDMKSDKEGNRNFHNDHLPKWNIPEYNPYPGFIKCFQHIAIDAKKIGIEILNANLDSELNCFEKISFQNLF